MSALRLQNAASLAKVSVDTAENEYRKDDEKWTIEGYALVIHPPQQVWLCGRVVQRRAEKLRGSPGERPAARLSEVGS